MYLQQSSGQRCERTAAWRVVSAARETVSGHAERGCWSSFSSLLNDVGQLKWRSSLVLRSYKLSSLIILVLSSVDLATRAREHCGLVPDVLGSILGKGNLGRLQQTKTCLQEIKRSGTIQRSN
ncbi:jg7237 [Pararge aegeria aegeria]|uniref:Jg7237 protein n=1 Tax=Pararge aegeria aegeria TaxID=348720 RepID=A0A8S4SGK0_9NEOP|nr:jg7237 [Pararge aegeria aegeria]